MSRSGLTSSGGPATDRPAGDRARLAGGLRWPPRASTAWPWPGQLGDLGSAQPIALWARGTASLRQACCRSTAIVGARAATAYGSQVAGEIAGAGWTMISGGTHGIDAAAQHAPRRPGCLRDDDRDAGLRGRTWTTRPGTPSCSTRSPLTARWSARCRPASSPARPGSWHGTRHRGAGRRDRRRGGLLPQRVDEHRGVCPRDRAAGHGRPRTGHLRLFRRV